MSRIARSARGEIVDFDLLEIKQQIADAKNRIDVASVNDFVNHRPVAAINIETLNAPVRNVQASSQVMQNELDADDRDWEVPAAKPVDDKVSGAAAAAEALIKGKAKK